MPLNGKFIEKYGKAWLTMDDGEKWMAVMSEVFDLREKMEPVAGTCEVVKRHTTYFTALWIVLTMILIPIILLAIKTWWNL